MRKMMWNRQQGAAAEIESTFRSQRLVDLVRRKMIGMTPNCEIDVVKRQAVRFKAVFYGRRQIEAATSPPDTVALQPRHTFARDSRSEFAVEDECGRCFVIAETESQDVHKMFFLSRLKAM